MNTPMRDRGRRAGAPRLEQILIAAERGAPMCAVDRVEAAVGKGLAGDRYHVGRGTFSTRGAVMPGAREVSLITSEAVTECSRRLDARIDAAALRRNLVVSGVDLEEMRGRTLAIGAVRLEIVSSCPPCGYLSRLLDEDMRSGLRHIGGMRAAVRVPGTLVSGAAITLDC